MKKCNPQRVVIEVIIIAISLAEIAAKWAFWEIVICVLFSAILVGSQINKITLIEGKLFGFFKVFSCLIAIAADLFTF